MRREPIYLAGVLAAITAQQASAQTTTSWISTVSPTWSTAANWSGGSPATGPQVADYPGTATLIKALDLAGGTGRVSYGAIFDFVAGGTGYTFSGTAGTVTGFIPRAGGPINGILNNDDNVQTFNVPIKLTSNSGIAGAGAGMVFNAAGGDMVFNGNNNAPSAPWTINLNGATNLTFDGSFNITIGSSGPGQIVNTNVGTFSGLVKNGAGTLTLGGTAANTYVGTNRINVGTILAAKADALGSGNALILTGGTFNSGGLNQNAGTLDLRASATLDLGTGASAVAFANSAAFSWVGNLNVLNWTLGVDSLRFGTDATGLTTTQLGEVVFFDLPGSPTAQIDANGFVSPMVVPEPSTLALSVLGGCGLLFVARRRKR
jgi:autotransporter-associated beta strand protein